MKSDFTMYERWAESHGLGRPAKWDAEAYMRGCWSARIEAMLAAARLRLHKAIDLRAELFLRGNRSSARRAFGQRYRQGRLPK